MEHPMITQIERTGYPENLQEQPEHFGTDYFGDEILDGDEIVEVGKEIVLVENLRRYLVEVEGYTFKLAK